jgi:hypothetical protein
MHQLSQLAVELREAAVELEEFLEKLRSERDDGVSVPELSAKYGEFIRSCAAKDCIERLDRIVKQMKDDEELGEDHELEPDLINTNQYALRVCHALLDISKVLVA